MRWKNRNEIGSLHRPYGHERHHRFANRYNYADNLGLHLALQNVKEAMTFDEAKAKLGETIGWPSAQDLYHFDPVIHWKSGDEWIELRGNLSIDELEAIVVYVKHVNAGLK